MYVLYLIMCFHHVNSGTTGNKTQALLIYLVQPLACCAKGAPGLKSQIGKSSRFLDCRIKLQFQRAISAAQEEEKSETNTKIALHFCKHSNVK